MKKGVVLVFLSLVILLSLMTILLSWSAYFEFTRHASISGLAGNTATVSLIVEGADTAAPVIDITDPDNTTYTSQVTHLNYTVSDNFGLSSCWYSLNLGATNTTVTCGNNVTGITSSEGSNTWNVYANDTSNNINSSSVTFSVDIEDEGGGGGGGGGAGGGGGGGAGPLLPARFEVTPEELNLILVSGEYHEEELKVKNTGGKRLVIDVSVTGIGDIASADTNQIVLGVGQEKSLNLLVKSPESGIYAGRIIFQSGNLKKEVFVIINVRGGESLFDVSLTIPPKYRIVKPGENVKAFVSLVQVGSAEQTDVTVTYLLKDFDGNTISTESETFFVYDSKSYVKEFHTSELPEGEYIAGIDVVYLEGFASSSAHFSISKFDINFQLVIIILLIILIITVIVHTILKYKKSKRYGVR